MPYVRGADLEGEGPPAVSVNRSAGVESDRGAEVAETPFGLPRGVVPTEDVHPVLSGGALAGAGHGAAAARGRYGDRRVEPGGVGCGPRVRGVVADRAQGAHDGGAPVVAGAGADDPAGIDEPRFRSVRWILDGIEWKRSDPWLRCV